jgi:hypothetical protein
MPEVKRTFEINKLLDKVEDGAYSCGFWQGWIHVERNDSDSFYGDSEKWSRWVTDCIARHGYKPIRDVGWVVTWTSGREEHSTHSLFKHDYSYRCRFTSIGLNYYGGRCAYGIHYNTSGSIYKEATYVGKIEGHIRKIFGVHD